MTINRDVVDTLLRLDGKVALITGAASGIGRAQVELFRAAGAKVAALDIDAHGLEALRASRDDHLLTLPVDLREPHSVKACVEAVQQELGGIDILCNTAGVLDGFKRCLDTDDELWDRTIDINVGSLFRLTREVLPHMLANGAGVIVNISSTAGLFAGGGGTAYTTSKHAVLGFTKQLSYDYGRQGIRANAICPGMIETSMTNDVLADSDSKFNKVVRSVPAGRVGTPQDIANVALFLASDAAQFIHGASFVVDGGLTIK
ncbi:short-chain dehydrogenase/reductase SDR [Pseudomonas putida]|uniref:Short-chain dehydrogenase/reductase SDR n=1 Tax=Pseudomonas putida TaxID=303 RepID=A0A379KP11_PSEPU|nr:glucose 1-dehydrogenase [Pseudomonas putida]SUD69756.1 short-chain dehydrogenase/reductase SDR [Pseudomonas putida]